MAPLCRSSLDDLLDAALAIGPLADHDGAMVIAQRPGDDLGGAGRRSVHQRARGKSG